jgi:hypothetical protein
MPPKFNPEAPENASLITLFSSLGLSNNAAVNLVRTPKQSAPFKALIDDYDLAGKTFDDKQAAALVKLSATGGKLEPPERGFVVQKIVNGALKSPDQVTGRSSVIINRVELKEVAAVKYVEGNPSGTPIDDEAFDKACGVGKLASTCSGSKLIIRYRAISCSATGDAEVVHLFPSNRPRRLERFRTTHGRYQKQYFRPKVSYSNQAILSQLIS